MLIMHERFEELILAEKHILERGILSNPRNVFCSETPRLVDFLGSPNLNFKCLLDRNIVSYLVAMIKGLNLSGLKHQEPYRSVAALQSILKAGNILSEAGLSYHEYMDNNNLSKADDELSFFRAADNLDPNIYLDIFLNNRDVILPNEIKQFKSGELSSGKLPERITQFERNIVIVKKAIAISLSKNQTPYQTMIDLMDWIYDEYMFSAPSFHFLSIYFSSWRISKMLKSNSLKDIRNATWDITYLQQLIKCYQKEPNTIWLFSTFDKAIRTTADLTFIRYDEDESNYMSRMEDSYGSMWGKKYNYGSKLIKKLIRFTENPDDENRKMNQFNGSAEYQLEVRRNVHKEYLRAI